MSDKLIVVTPAGREHYLELLAHYVLRDPAVQEWQLWDNCRRESDRAYLQRLAQRDARIRVVTIANPDGTNKSVNRFYRYCDDAQAFYIKVDDDVVFIEDGALGRLHQAALAQRSAAQAQGLPGPLWWSAMVVNNAVCAWLLKYHSQVELPEELSCQAAHAVGWGSPFFAQRLHERFLAHAADGRLSAFKVPDFPVSLSRFSINCLGYFGADVIALGERFCPPEVDDEEWLSAVLPSLTGRSGAIVGDALVSHFAFYTQEQDLLRNGVLERYYALAGLRTPAYPVKPLSLRRKVKRWWQSRNGADPRV
ncbi:hypothetical protein LZ017_17455 [Pelomonas sp. CA6]|uniref:hypothetical protein n=1 Tax=Pelomonas sp. CA6 TaxID=2907999 RepID=UPI001F4C4572|nr:hypothetical protein [Pelomonas sp. CA6]MCH7345172.1 hypothetical protein [Pelomonas sp. CA6]